MPGTPSKLSHPGPGSGIPETLTGAGVSAGPPLAAVADRFKDSPEELLRGQGPGHLGSCLLKDVRELRHTGKRKEEQRVTSEA